MLPHFWQYQSAPGCKKTAYRFCIGCLFEVTLANRRKAAYLRFSIGFVARNRNFLFFFCRQVLSCIGFIETQIMWFCFTCATQLKATLLLDPLRLGASSEAFRHKTNQKASFSGD